MLACAQLNTDRITAIGRNALYFDDYVLSIQYFNQVIKLKPYLSEPYLLRAIAKIQLGDYVGAEIDCNAAIERNPFQPGAYYTRGFIYRQTNQLEKAEHDFNEALVFAPENKTYIAMRADLVSRFREAGYVIDDSMGTIITKTYFWLFASAEQLEQLNCGDDMTVYIYAPPISA